MKSLTYNNLLRKHLISFIIEILESIKNNTLIDFCLYIKFDKNNTQVQFPQHLFDGNFVAIFIQNQYWDLIVDENKKGFYVTLDFSKDTGNSYGNKLDLHKIYIPFYSIVLFYDPISQFCLDFRQFFLDDVEYNIINNI